jgi:hypothetical protein
LIEIAATHKEEKMKETALLMAKVALSGFLLIGGTHISSASDQARDDRVEDIYIARSIRESRTAPSEFCSAAKTGLTDVFAEDQYQFQSTATRGSDGLMVDTNVRTIGQIHACLGFTDDPGRISFYGKGQVGTLKFTGLGDCQMKQNYPGPGLIVLRCFLDLSGLPKGYIGGLLTTSSLSSRIMLGDKTDPPGYTQSSIATIRLWKAR